jgi:hypothetical protein
VTLRFSALRFCFRALDAVHFPAGKSANVLRGAFGHLLRRTSSASTYQRLFEPSASRAPSGLADPPRPFVFRAAHLDGRTVQPGERFEFGVNLFDLAADPTEALLSTFRELAREGVGPTRGRAELADVAESAMTLSLEPPTQRIGRIRVRFLTPAELKRENQIEAEPDFQTLAARVRDRISTLRSLYGDGPLEIDFCCFSERAAQVRMTRCELQHVSVERRSSRTGQSHPIGGFTGFAEYEGELTEFVPYLHAAKWTGVGRQTVWGKGELEVDAIG